MQYLCVNDMSELKPTKYSSVSIPSATFYRLAELVGHRGFRSTAEVVMHCIRKNEFEISTWLDQIEERKEKEGREFKDR
jgi:hypothetical protein